MCGIYASVSTTQRIRPSEGQKQLLSKRGPDHVGELELTLESANIPIQITLISTVLALRGGHVTAQPLSDKLTESVLCWNGEAWKIGQTIVQGNDAEAVLNLLVSISLGCSKTKSISLVLEVLQSITGPYTFVYLDKAHDLLYFGRDYIGRRSLLYNINDGAIQLSSLTNDTSGAWLEVEADGIYILALSGDITHPALAEFSYESSQEHNLNIYHSPRVLTSSSFPKVSLGMLNMSLPQKAYDLNAQMVAVDEIESCLRKSLKLRALGIYCPSQLPAANCTKLAILFSGGLDCTIIARMAHDLLPVDAEIDLLNVAFENPRVVKAAKSVQLKINQQNNAAVSLGSTDGKDRCLGPEEGIDQQSEQDGKISAYESCPDRITGRKSLEELRAVCPSRTWRFVEINIPYTEALSHRDRVVALMHPHNTEMDLSIAYALYFAARGSGLASTAENLPSVAYETPARVLFSGLGADELFAGYTRHATAFQRRGLPGLLAELELDLSRLGKRNLGRDDRVISNWGREARYPYLDEALIEWALESPVWTKCGFGAPQENESRPQRKFEPGKLVLRLLAERLGMSTVAVEKKRAIQFGARTAKMETGKTKGTSSILP